MKPFQSINSKLDSVFHIKYTLTRGGFYFGHVPIFNNSSLYESMSRLEVMTLVHFKIIVNELARLL